MHRSYSLTNMDKEALAPYFRGLIHELTSNTIDCVELSYLNIGPSQCTDILEFLGYERDDDWNTNGWEQDTWYYFAKDNIKLCMFYCGYTGSINLSLREEE